MYRMIATAAFVLLGASPLLAGPQGDYEVVGTNPGREGSYRGTVTVTQTGETYRVVWQVGGETFVGTGIGNDEFIAVSYTSDGSTGLALYGEQAGDWVGIWTYAGGREVGTESWRR